MRTLAATAVLLFALSYPTPAQDARKAPPAAEGNPAKTAEPKLDQAELDKQFEKTMTGATMIGRFTLERPGNNGGGNRQPGEDRYHINKVTKTSGDHWLFVARVQYGQKDLTVPILLQVKWAGDTPVITLTDMTIPGMGTYTARVLVYRDHYAGYWSGGDHGGSMWGRIEHDDAQPAPAGPAAPKTGEPAK